MASPCHAEDSIRSWIPKIGGTLRAKFEYQTDINNARFQVRDARVNVRGWLSSFLDYKLEINLSEKGKIRTHDLYARLHFGEQFKLTAGQFRVPVSVDAARSPHERWFANRSCVGKDIGNIFDIGIKGTYALKSTPLTAEFGVFNGMDYALSDEVWLKHFLFVGHLNYLIDGFDINASVMTTRPDRVRINIYDVSVSYAFGRFMVEGEYMYKHYINDPMKPVHAYNIMGMYGLPIKSPYLNMIKFMGRFDSMTDDSNGFTDETTGLLPIDDIGRNRVSLGVTLGYYKKVKAELRLNFEKYFYDDGVEIAPSDHDKLVAEIMFNF